MSSWAILAPALASSIGTMATAGASVSDMSARTDNILKAIDLESDSYITQVDILADQEKQIQRELGDVMSQRGLEAMKTEARLRAASAETGTSGGTTELAVMEERMAASLDNAISIKRKRDSETEIYRRKTLANISYKNRMNELAGSITSPISAGLSVAASGLQGASMGLNIYSQFAGSKDTTEAAY